MLIILKIVLAIFAVSWVGGVIYLLIGHPKFIYHDLMGWHQPDRNAEFWNDGCSNHCKCKYCRKEIMQDSQGNWFTF